jgi:hypothetical protein
MRDQPGVAQGWIQSFIGQKRTSEITLIACILYDTHNDQVVYLLIKKKRFFKLKGRKRYNFPNRECKELRKLTATEQKEARLILLLEVLSQLINEFPKFTPHYQPAIPIASAGALLTLRELG